MQLERNDCISLNITVLRKKILSHHEKMSIFLYFGIFYLLQLFQCCYTLNFNRIIVQQIDSFFKELLLVNKNVKRILRCGNDCQEYMQRQRLNLGLRIHCIFIKNFEKSFGCRSIDLKTFYSSSFYITRLCSQILFFRFR